MSAVRVVTVDDQRVFRTAARALIDSTPGFVLAGEATSGRDSLDAVDALDPDLVLLDVRMPGLDGIETARRLTAAHPDLVVILVTGDDLDDVRDLARRSGAADLVLKERLRPGLIRRLWARHGSARGARAPE
jgi:two-component system, NarL family, invasion response regulator UvrY